MGKSVYNSQYGIMGKVGITIQEYVKGDSRLQVVVEGKAGQMGKTLRKWREEFGGE